MFSVCWKIKQEGGPTTSRYQRPLSCCLDLLRAAVTKCHKLVASPKETYILSQCWRLEVQEQGVGRTILPLRALGEDLFQSFLLISSGLLANFGIPWLDHPDICLYVLMAFFLCVSLRQFLLFIKTSIIGLEAHPTLAWLIFTSYICYDLVSK